MKNNTTNLNKFSVKSKHDFMVCLGLSSGIIFIPAWLHIIVVRTIQGSSSVFLNLCFLSFGIFKLWQVRKNWGNFNAYSEEKFIGYAFILGGLGLFFSFWGLTEVQAICWSISILGIFISTFGLRFLKEYWFPVFLVLFGLFPNYRYIAHTTWSLIAPDALLERTMAAISGFILNLMGQNAIVNGQIIQLGDGAVDVGAGCSGFSMACALTGMGFFMGLLMKLTWRKTICLMVIGAFVALALNVPRILLLAFAAVYWGEKSFDFWHNGIGSQIFSGIMFTVYYYAAIAIANNRKILS